MAFKKIRYCAPLRAGSLEGYKGFAALLFFLGLALAWSGSSLAAGTAQDSPKPATEATVAAQKNMVRHLNFADLQDFADARQGFIAPLHDQGRVPADNGGMAWNLEPYAFLNTDNGPDGKTPPATGPNTVNPSLWRQSQLVMINGLFKVTDRLYQIRNVDVSNMTIIEGDTGLIVVDPLVSVETARAALNLYFEHRPRKPIKFIIYSHSHTDHYGGVEGIISQKDVDEGKVRIIAPVGFLEAALAENVMAGTAMGRRAMYMYGNLLPAGPQGHVGSGLGLKTSEGRVSLIPPTDLISASGQKMRLDGLDFEFLLAPGTEAPSEMHWYIPQLKAVTTAENCTHTMHNLYTLRGAKTRDPVSWSKALDETLERWGKDAQVLYSMHHWPVWGNDRVCKSIANGRDLYRYINDQTLHMANHGHTMLEIAETLELPPELAHEFSLRGYYGSLNHNVKAVYNFYLGWFDGNPAHLNPLPPVDAAKKQVEYMGGAAAVLERARQDYAKGEYRWVAEVVDKVIFADPSNMEARQLAADALEQLGYQAESGPWRNFYLSGAQDLRRPQMPLSVAQQMAPGAMPQTTNAQRDGLPPEMFFDYLGMRMNGPKAQGQKIQLRVELVNDTQAGKPAKVAERWDLDVANSVLHAHKVKDAAATGNPQAVFTGDRHAMMGLLTGVISPEDAAAKGMLRGDPRAVKQFTGLLDTLLPTFNIIFPNDK